MVVLKGDTVLLIRRGKAPREGEWSLPGGAQKLGETLREAAAREVHEETGLKVTPVTLLDAVDSILRDDSGRVKYHYALVDFAAEWRGGEPVPGGDAIEVRWAACADLDSYALWDKTLHVIRMAVSRRDDD